MSILQENFYYIVKIQKLAYKKSLKPRNYALSNIVWFNNNFIFTKQKP